MARTIGREGSVRVAIADDSRLIFSDDYRDGWVEGFRGIGCDVQVFDIGPLRQAISSSPYSTTAPRGLGKMVATNIVQWRPDLVWCHHGRAASNDQFLGELHRHGIKTAVYLCDEPYEVGETARYSPKFGSAFTMDLCTVDTHKLARGDRASREHVWYLPPCADVQRFQFDNDKDRSGAFFLGNAGLVPRPGWLEPVERVAGADIRYWPHKERKSVAKGHPKWIQASDHPHWYSSCLVGLNVHRHPGITKKCFERRVLHRPKQMHVPSGMKLCSRAPTLEGTGMWNDADLPASHVNPRFFEMASCGTLVVSDDHRSELARMFPMAPRAESPEHFLELVLYYLANEREALQIGRACSFLISKRHSYQHRAAEALIRVGLRESGEDSLATSLGEPSDWLSPQGFVELPGSSFSDRTGRYERFSPQLGMSWTRTSGRLSEASSIDVPNPWLS